MGWPKPAGKYFACTSAPTTESGLLVKLSAPLSGCSFRLVMPSPSATRISEVTTHTMRGRVAVLVVPELLAVAGDEQHRVVDARADRQHRQDEGAPPVHREAGVFGKQIDGSLSAAESQGHREDGQEPQDRAPVGEQQDQDH